ncbi:hypothetical protein AAHA92_09303 [Salvia divinorum]|uniref:Secreted protein n=1 Tax=Salvia divinorum TaxID=28513 RepID=A0ABD1HUF9_SALDI
MLRNYYSSSLISFGCFLHLVVDWWGQDSADGLSRDGLCTAVPGRSLGCLGRALGCSAEAVGSQLAGQF